MDTRLLKDSFAVVAPRAGELAEFFYADLFLRGGQQVREMFPPSMTAQRGRLLGALIRTVTGIDDLDSTAAYLTGLGRDHRKFGADQQWMYDLAGASLLAALGHFAGDAWTPEVAGTWAEAYGIIAGVMLDGARADAEAGNPSWWNAAVLDVDRRGADIAVITARLDTAMTWLPGQSVSVLFDGMPWRFYSPANIPDSSRIMELHVRACGMTSAHLVQHAVRGSALRIGPAVGSFTLDMSSGADVAMAAHSTGLAPVKAIIRQLADLPGDAYHPQVHLWLGAHTPEGLYDLEDMEKLAAEHPWLTLVTELDEQVAMRDAYVAGSTSFVTAAVGQFRELGAAHIHVEDYAWEGSVNG